MASEMLPKLEKVSKGFERFKKVYFLCFNYLNSWERFQCNGTDFNAVDRIPQGGTYSNKMRQIIVEHFPLRKWTEKNSATDSKAVGKNQKV